jgi:two-component system LytT family response regulator
MSEKKIRALIVDDERLARQKLKTLLSRLPDVEIVAEAATGDEAITMIEEHQPELLFLDIQMPGMDGFELLREIGVDAVPDVIFVTAYDRYAVAAFDVQAVDYLLKPFDLPRLNQALERVRKRRAEPDRRDDLALKLNTLLQQLAPTQEPLQRIMLKSSGRITFLKTSEITYLEAADNYVRVHSGRESHLIRDTLTNFETRLDRRQFVRIHRSVIVNIDSIAEIRALFHGDHSVLLSDGTELPFGRSYRENLELLLGRSL